MHKQKHLESEGRKCQCDLFAPLFLKVRMKISSFLSDPAFSESYKNVRRILLALLKCVMISKWPYFLLKLKEPVVQLS